MSEARLIQRTIAHMTAESYAVMPMRNRLADLAAIRWNIPGMTMLRVCRMEEAEKVKRHLKAIIVELPIYGVRGALAWCLRAQNRFLVAAWEYRKNEWVVEWWSAQLIDAVHEVVCFERWGDL